MLKVWVLTLYIAVPHRPDYKVDRIGMYATHAECERAAWLAGLHPDSDGRRVILRTCDAQWLIAQKRG